MTQFSFGFRIFLVCVLAIIALIWYATTFGGVGGQSADSPDGKYIVMISTRLAPKPGDWYTITLTDRSSDITLRRFEFQLSSDETPKPLRGAPRVIRWSPNSDIADIELGEKPCVRVYVP